MGTRPILFEEKQRGAGLYTKNNNSYNNNAVEREVSQG